MKHLSKILILVALSLTNYAYAGSEGRGGGDTCEDRIKVIRDDLRSWIIKGGHRAMVFPQGLTPEVYASRMLKQIANAKIACVSKGDPGFPVQIKGVPKVCSFELTPTISKITCDTVKFTATGEEPQYTLVHHEYAGLSRLEIPNGADSQYFLSNQISKSLTNQVVKRLAVVTPIVPGVKAEWQLVSGDEAVRLVPPLLRAINKTGGGSCGGMLGDTYPGATINKTGSPANQGRELYKNISGGAPQFKISDKWTEQGHVQSPLQGQLTRYIYIDPTGRSIEELKHEGFRDTEVDVGTIFEPKLVVERTMTPFETCYSSKGSAVWGTDSKCGFVGCDPAGSSWGTPASSNKAKSDIVNDLFPPMESKP